MKTVVLHDVAPSSLLDTGLQSPEYGLWRRVTEPTQLVLSFAVAATNISEESTDTIFREGPNTLSEASQILSELLKISSALLMKLDVRSCESRGSARACVFVLARTPQYPMQC
jgi:hypothetical protein